MNSGDRAQRAVKVRSLRTGMHLLSGVIIRNARFESKGKGRLEFSAEYLLNFPFCTTVAARRAQPRIDQCVITTNRTGKWKLRFEMNARNKLHSYETRRYYSGTSGGTLFQLQNGIGISLLSLGLCTVQVTLRKLSSFLIRPVSRGAETYRGEDGGQHGEG